MTDLTDDEIDAIARRTDTILSRYRAIPLHALQYRLGEVGKHRIEPHLLERALVELRNNRRPRRGRASAGPWWTSDGLLASRDLARDEAEAVSESIQPSVSEFASSLRPQTLDTLAMVLSDHVQSDHAPAFSPTVESVLLARHIAVTTEDRVWQLHASGRQAIMWVTHEPDWIYPNDPRLWAFLSRCSQERAQPVVLARKLAVGCFPMFKALGVRGLQYYSTIVADADLARTRQLRDELGWSHVAAVSTFKDSQLVQHLQNAARTATSSTPEVDRAIADAIQRGFATSAAAPGDLVKWWEASELHLPRPVRHAFERWEAWRAFRPSRSRSAAAAPDLATDSSEASEDRRVDDAEPLAAPSPQEKTFGRETRVIRVPLRY